MQAMGDSGYPLSNVHRMLLVGGGAAVVNKRVRT